jgi:hypothetical protein
MIRLRRTVCHAAALVALLPGWARAQELEDEQRLAGVERVAVQAEVVWDDLITTSAGGATSAQFREALIQTFRAAMAKAGPALDAAAAGEVVCRVETVYDGGFIAYSARVEYRQPMGDGAKRGTTWFTSWMGTLGVGGLHQMFSLGERCANAFAEAWSAANAG